MGSVGRFGSGIAALRELQWPMIPRSRQVCGLAGVEPLFLGPAAEDGHGIRYLRDIGCDLALQIVHPPLLPSVDLGCRQPSDAYQHVDRCHQMTIGKCCLGCLDDPIFEPALNHCGHR